MTAGPCGTAIQPGQSATARAGSPCCRGPIASGMAIPLAGQGLSARPSRADQQLRDPRAGPLDQLALRRAGAGPGAQGVPASTAARLAGGFGSRCFLRRGCDRNHGTDDGEEAERVGRPFGAGAHPYLYAGTDRIDDATLHLPAESWLPTDLQQNPTGVERDADGIFRTRLAGRGPWRSGWTPRTPISRRLPATPCRVRRAGAAAWEWIR